MVKKVKLPKKSKKDKSKKDKSKKGKGKKLQKSEAKKPEVEQEEPKYGVRYVAAKVGCSHLKVQKHLRKEKMPRVGRYYDLENQKKADKVVKDLS